MCVCCVVCVCVFVCVCVCVYVCVCVCVCMCVCVLCVCVDGGWVGVDGVIVNKGEVYLQLLLPSPLPLPPSLSPLLLA